MKTAPALFVFMLAFRAGGSAAENYYVSPAGNDGNPGSKAAPFATVAHARDVVRAALARSGGLSGGATVWIGRGDYPLAATLEWTAADSGRAGAPVIYRALGDGPARLLGSVAVVTCLARVEGTNEGESMQGNYRYTRVYQRIAGAWKTTNFEATRIPKNRRE